MTHNADWPYDPETETLPATMEPVFVSIELDDHEHIDGVHYSGAAISRIDNPDDAELRIYRADEQTAIETAQQIVDATPGYYTANILASWLREMEIVPSHSQLLAAWNAHPYDDEKLIEVFVAQNDLG